MNNYDQNFVKIAMITPKTILGKPEENAKEIIRVMKEDKYGAILVFPELAVTGYSLNDWFFNTELRIEHDRALKSIIDANEDHLIIIGGLLEWENNLYNVAYVINNHDIIGIVPKINLPAYREFKENRYFEDGSRWYSEAGYVNVLGQNVPIGSLLFSENTDRFNFGIEICEDLWVNHSPHLDLYANGAEIVFNLSASTFRNAKQDLRATLVNAAAIKGTGAYIYCSNGVLETSSDVLYTGHQIASVMGDVLYNSEHFEDDTIINYVDIDIEKIRYKRLQKHAYHEVFKTKGITNKNVFFELKKNFSGGLHTKPVKLPFALSETMAEEVIKVLSAALSKRLSHIGTKDIVIGISGGLDSTLALLIAVETFKSKKLSTKTIHAISIPALATSEKTKDKILRLVSTLDIDFKEINIKDEVLNNLTLIGHDHNTHDITYENAQARYRTYLLMNLANKYRGIVLGTGDMSEIALGWCTFNGDHMSMYDINAGLPKTAVRSLVRHFAEKHDQMRDILTIIADAPITPELTDDTQKTEDSIGSYDINDFILEELLDNGSSKNKLLFLLKEVYNLTVDDAENYYNRFIRRFKSQQFKRLTAPEGVKIFDISLSPRSDLYINGDIK